MPLIEGGSVVHTPLTEMMPGRFEVVSSFRPSGSLTQKLQMDNTASKIQLAYFQKFIYAIGGAAIKQSHLAGSLEGGGSEHRCRGIHLPPSFKRSVKSQQDVSASADAVQVLATQA